MLMERTSLSNDYESCLVVSHNGICDQGTIFFFLSIDEDTIGSSSPVAGTVAVAITTVVAADGSTDDHSS